jgi:hypothetical protein
MNKIKINIEEDEYSKIIRESHQKNVKGATAPSGRFKVELEEKQARLTEALDTLIPYGTFYFAYDIISDEITNIGGIDRWLGIDNDDFNLILYNNLFHPALKATQGFYAKGLVKALNTSYKDKNGNEKRIELDIEETYFHYNQAIRKGIDRNDFWFVKRILVPFAYTEDNRMLSWLNIFTIINDFEYHPFKFHDSSLSKEELKHVKDCSIGGITRNEQLQILKSMLKVGENEAKKPKTVENRVKEWIEILDAYALLIRDEKTEPTATNVASLLGNCDKRYVGNHNKHILAVIDRNFAANQSNLNEQNNQSPHIFKEAIDFVRFLVEQSILPLKK